MLVMRPLYWTALITHQLSALPTNKLEYCVQVLLKCLSYVMMTCIPFTEICNESSVRLVNGESDRAGAVEVCQNGVWVPVCSDQWDIPDATVVCRQLGYGETLG